MNRAFLSDLARAVASLIAVAGFVAAVTLIAIAVAPVPVPV